jgi:cold shock CspA family protein
LRGTLLWFNESKDHGRITTDDGEEFIVHRSGFQVGHVPAGRCAGTAVSFERNGEETEGHALAIDVAVLEELPGRRARRRAGGYSRW